MRSAGIFLDYQGKRYFSVGHCVSISNYSPSYVRQLARRSKVLAVNYAGQWYIDIDDFVAKYAPRPTAVIPNAPLPTTEINLDDYGI